LRYNETRHKRPHPMAMVTEASMIIAEDLNLNYDFTSLLFLKQQNYQRNLEYASENDVAYHILNILTDAMRSLGNLQFSLFSEISLFELRPDIYLVSTAGSPKGVVEVKKPNKTTGKRVLEEASSLNQIHAYLQMLRSFHSVEEGFGRSFLRRECIRMESKFESYDTIFMEKLSIIP
jgi:hypothetical protein